MAFHFSCLLASVLLALVGAEIYDQGPQTFFARSAAKGSLSSQPEQNQNKEYVLYLTPAQAKALEIGGAFVKPHPDYEPEPSENEGPRVTEEQNESSEEANNNKEEEPKKQLNSELEEIFKLLNQHNIVEELEKLQEELATEKPREIPRRFNVTPKPQQEEKQAIAPSSNDLSQAKSYTYVRLIHNSAESQALKPKPYRVQRPSSYYNNNQESADKQEKNRAEETTESENQENKIQNEQNDVFAQKRNQLLKNELELQAKLRELQNSPKHNDQKFAIEIENLRTNLEKQNALSKVEAIAKVAPAFIREKINANRRPVEEVKHVTRPVIVRIPPFEVKVPHPYFAPSQIVQRVPVPNVSTEKNEAEQPAPAEEEKRIPVNVNKNIYVKVNRPYLVERLVPVQVRKETPTQVPTQNPEQVTILRHIWEH